MNRDSSFWEVDTFHRQSDLLVVGGGITGLSTALFFKRKHPESRVAVLERNWPPLGASTRNAGFACIGSVGEHLADLKKEEEARVGNRIRQRYEGLQLLRKTLGDDRIGYEPCGGCELFTSDEQFQAVSSHIDRFNNWLAELTGEREVYSISKRNGYPVIKNRLEGALHAGRMIATLVEAVQREGIPILWNCRVGQIDQEEGAVLLTCGTTLKAGKIVVATNGFIRQLLPEIDVTPARGYIFVSRKLDVMPWKGTFHHDRGYIYFRNLGNRLLLGGARNADERNEATDQFGVNKTIKNRLLEFSGGVLKFSDMQIEYEWSGIMGFTPTKTPVVQHIGDHLAVAAGLSGMGVAIGMEIGRSTAEMIDPGS